MSCGKLKPKTAFVLGTRPEIIKLSPVIKECLRRDYQITLIHTGQHFSYTMDRVFFRQLELPEPAFSLEVGRKYCLQGAQTGEMLRLVEEILLKEDEKEPYNFVIVQGDTNSALAGALAAVKLQIPVAHVEAGLRSYDRRMAEEHNRVIIDHISDLLFSPTRQSYENLIREGIPQNRILITGNTIVDALKENLAAALKTGERIEGIPDKFVLVTLHRAENVDNYDVLSKFIQLLERIDYPMVFPVHPRTERRLKEFNLWEDIISIPRIRLMEPVGYLQFILLEESASLIITDSGGVQEEACILGKPCITFRDNTERPETVEAGMNIVSGTLQTDMESLLEKIHSILKSGFVPDERHKSVFGDGLAASRIADALAKEFEKKNAN